jgi:4,5-DOPA dioxygenase extradiol
MKEKTPVIFVSHGAPSLLLDGTKAEQFFRNISATFPKPKGILVVSGHWEEREFTVSTIKKQQTIYDFYGFQQELYEYKYEPAGAVDLAEKTKSLLESKGIKVNTAERGLDHGAWIPLICMYPDADIPVTQLALKRNGRPEEFVKAGEAIRSLREEGYLILASGSTTHNLRDFGRYGKNSEAVKYAVDFDEWLEKAIINRDVESLKDYRSKAPEANRNHPTDDHFNPLLVAVGASEGSGEKVHNEFVFGFLSLAAYRWNG